jgi:hypothetical protein
LQTEPQTATSETPLAYEVRQAPALKVDPMRHSGLGTFAEAYQARMCVPFPTGGAEEAVGVPHDDVAL